MAKDPIKEMRRIAAKPILAEMRWQRKTLPSPLSKLMDYLSKNLFNPDLSAAKAWQGSGIKDHGISVAFRDATGFTLAKYIDRRRLQVSDPMVRTALGIEPAQISWAVGFKYYGTFEAAYREMFGETPEQARQKAGLPSIDYTAWRCGYFGELDADEAWKHHQTWLQIYPSVEERLRQEYGASESASVMDVHGAEIERLTAEGFWLKMQSLPFEEQKRRVRGIRFHSKVFFDLLRKKSREEGRLDRQRGIEVAKLALLSLEKCDEIFGEEIHDLRALGWAWLANAHVMAADFSAAKLAFSKSDRAWSVPRARQDTKTLARVCRLKAKLLMYLRKYDRALQTIDRACAMFQLESNSKATIRALVQRASILGYADRLEDSIETLKKAQQLLEQNPDDYLEFAVAGNLANSFARNGQFRNAVNSLAQAAEYSKQLESPLARFELRWIEGDIRLGMEDPLAAEELYSTARRGFKDLREWNSFVLTSLDLAILASKKRKWSEVLELVCPVLPILESRQFHPETVAAISLLGNSVSDNNLSPVQLETLRDELRRDPLSALS